MAETVLHADEHALHSNGFVNSAQNQAALDASIGDPTRNSSAEGIADSEAPYSSSCHLLPQKGRVPQHPTAFFKDPNAQVIAHVSSFAHSHSISAFTNGKLQADCAGFPYPVALSKGAQMHLTTANEGFTYPQQFVFEPSTAARVALCEEAVHFLHKDQVESTEPYGHNEDCTSPHVKSNDSHAPSRVVGAGFAHVVKKTQDPNVQLSMAYVNSCQESTSSHKEGEDSTDTLGSYEDLEFSHAGCDDSCDDSEDFTYVQRTRGDATIAHDSVQDPLKELLDPYIQQADADVTSFLQRCSSECSSAISMVTNATSEVTSRLDNTYKSVDGIESHWTDAKHGSYLDYMETSFVNNLYGREYCALDVCGQQPFHQVSKDSSPWPSTLFEFKTWQSGDWHRRSMLKPPLLTCIPLALRKSPWVNHFRHHNFSQARHQIKMENVSSIFCVIDGEEEVNSPSTEMYKGAFGRDHASGSNLGHVERLLCKNGGSGSEAVGVLKQGGLQEFGHGTEIPRFSNMKKRGIESDFEQDPSIRREIFLRSKCEDR